eukprot:scaffold3042_cov127-Skeletonema_dohrnii-CCMP3373.AAC.6
MSEVVEVDDTSCCASCGITAKDDMKLKICTACKLVRYCSVKCQKEHRPKHKRECKQRAAELHDEILFQQPESSHLGDCPICCLPHLIYRSKANVWGCCGKMICRGCQCANTMREIEGSMDRRCPFCRHPLPATEEEALKLLMRRVEANDPLSLVEVGAKRYSEGDYASAFKYWTNAAESGDASAHYHLSLLHHDGEGVETDMKKAVYHSEKAAIAGHPIGRYHLGCAEFDDVQKLKESFQRGDVSKEDFAAALRGHHAAVEATKSPQRRKAAEATMYGK